MPTLEGTTLGRYHLTRLLGQGGMAEVYQASDDQLHREVALKVVHLSQEEDVARFRREAELLGPLTHEHILPVFDCGVQDPWHYLVMPYLREGTLRDRLQARGPLSSAEAGLLLEQIASAVHYAQERGILHRDLKPSNILLRDATFVYVADFGIAKVLSQERQLTQTGMVVGTPEYLAPELLEQPASPSTEVYALGVLLYEMLTGRLPFTGPTVSAIMQQQASAEPVPPSHLDPAISLPVEQVVLRALEKDPARRFPTPQALAQAYRRALQEADGPLRSDVVASPNGAITPLVLAHASRRSPVRRPLPLLIGGLLLEMLLVAVAFWLGAHFSGASTAAPPRTLVTYLPASTPPTATVVPSPTATVVPSPTATVVPSPTATKTPCSIMDGANVLKQAQVCPAMQTLSYPVTVYTTNTFSQSDGDFDLLVHSLVTGPRMIIIAIDVKPQPAPGPPQFHVTIVGGISVPLTDPQYQQAINVFNQAAQTGGYSKATIAAIQTLHTEGA